MDLGLVARVASAKVSRFSLSNFFQMRLAHQLVNHLYSLFAEGIAEIILFADQNTVAERLRNQGDRNP